MKTMRLGKYFLSTAIMAFFVLSTGNVFAENAKRHCDHVGNNTSGCTDSNNFLVVSPYWQVDSGSYTFIAVTHSSLSGMASQIGVRMNAFTSTGGVYDTAAAFTVMAGNTERLFIVPTGHSTINATSIPTAKFMTGTSDFTHGSIRANPVMTHPTLKYTTQNGVGKKLFIGDGFRDITMLSYWGSVIIEANTTGFAMEFIGDMNDSSAHFNQSVNHLIATCGGGDTPAYTDCGSDTAANRHMYDKMHTGPNLQ
jgi:hypothetical protein